MKGLTRNAPHSRGFALVLVLGLIAGLVAVSVLFFALVREQSRHARQQLHLVSTSHLTDLAVQEALAKLYEGMSAATAPAGQAKASMTAAPGLMEILRYDVPYNRGTETGQTAFAMPFQNRPFFRDPFAPFYSNRAANPRWIPLYSRKWFAPATPYLGLTTNGAPELPNPDYNPAVLFNINTPHNPFRPGEYYLSGAVVPPAFPRREKDREGRFPEVGMEGAFTFRPGEPATDRPVYVQWLPVLEDPTRPPGPANQMIGRYAYWVDVENTKIHLHRASRPWRTHRAFALTGDADATALGTGSYFHQSSQNPSIRLRKDIESLLPGPGGRADGSQDVAVPSVVGASLRALWLDWIGDEPPAAADHSLVDWDYVEAVRPLVSAAGGWVSFSDLLASRAKLALDGTFPHLQHPEEAFSLLDPAIATADLPASRIAEAAFLRTIQSALTTYGYEEERDPLGHPKIDLVKFLTQHRAAAGAGGNPDLLRSSDLWHRLRDPKYHAAYEPGLVASGGRAQSFLRSLNRFAGTGNPARDANGEAAALQMLVNMVEYTLADNQPPLIDESRGLVGHRSIPYVAEVATRARSALWLLPREDLLNPEILLARDASGNFTYIHNGRNLEFYTSHVLLDVALAFVNPDPFATRVFNGTVTLNYSWGTLPPGAQVVSGPQTRPLQGLYAAVPETGKDQPGSVRVLGEAVVFPLGLVPVRTLWEKTYATALRIAGWEIRDGNGLWHKVPVRHPGSAQNPIPWWAMAQSARNTGLLKLGPDEKAFGGNTLADYARISAAHGFRAVGWFTVPEKKPGEENLLHRLEMMGWDWKTHPPQKMEADEFQDFTDFILSLRWRAVFESVYALDPALGHRTGATDARPDYEPNLRGHLYGTTGHVWRHGGADGISEKAPSENAPDPGTGHRFATLNREPESKGFRLGQQIAINPAQRSWQGMSPHGIGYQSMTRQIPFLSAAVQAGQEEESFMAQAKPGGLLKNFAALQLDTFPLESRQFTTKDDGKWLDEVAQALGRIPPGFKSARVSRDAHIETLEVTSLPEIKALKTDSDALHGKSLRGLFAGAPRAAMMTSIGEIGLVHSGLPNFPILLTEAHGTNEFLLNSPKNGPPMRMLLDLFTPGALIHPATGRPISRADWEKGAGPSHTPETPRLGTWNVNSALAHESYMVIRQGAHGTQEELKKEVDPSQLPARVIWHPSAGGWRRNAFGNEHAFSKQLAETDRKIPGEPLDRLASPFASLPRGWPAWVATVGGDFTPSRAIGFGTWAPFSPGYNTFAPGMFTWMAGMGVAQSPPYYQTAFANVGADDSLHSRLLTFGSDGRKELELDGDGQIKKLNENDGFLRGRFTSDEWLDFQSLTGSAQTAPRHFATRFALFPLRHRVSDLALNYNYGAELRHFHTALNPRASAYPPVVNSDGRIEGQFSDYNHFPGSHLASGLFLNAPLVLLANQASTSANAFTLHIVVQTIRDEGARRPGVSNSGPGHSDPDDLVLSESWTRLVVEKEKPTDPRDFTPRLWVVRRETR